MCLCYHTVFRVNTLNIAPITKLQEKGKAKRRESNKISDSLGRARKLDTWNTFLFLFPAISVAIRYWKIRLFFVLMKQMEKKKNPQPKKRTFFLGDRLPWNVCLLQIPCKLAGLLSCVRFPIGWASGLTLSSSLTNKI